MSSVKVNVGRRNQIDVPRTMIDRVVGYFNPQAGLERLRARTMMTLAGGYDGGRRDRRGTKRWRPPEASADADILPDMPDLRSRSRDLARNVPIATGAIATAVTNVVGDGLALQASIDRELLGLSDEQADAWERGAEREFGLFCKTADFTRVQLLQEMQALVFRGPLESGDIFIVRRFRRDPGDVYGTKLQVLEADRVSNPNRAADSDKIAGGIETNEHGVHVACHVSNRHPGALRPKALKWDRVAIRTSAGKIAVLHLYDRMRPEQTRGVPYLAPVIEHLKQLGDYADAEVRAAVLSALYTVFVTSDADQTETPIAGEKDSGLDDNEIKMGTGAIVNLSPGEDINTTTPGRPNSEFDPFVQAILRQIGVALEIPFELLIKHFTASYSASRAALEMAWQFFRRRRTWLARNFCQVVYEWCIEEAVALGRISAPGFFADPIIRQAYLGALWIGPNRASIDPKKEAEADEIDVRLGVKTREQVCLERTGGQWEDKHRQLVKEKAARDEAGFADSAPAAPAAAGDNSNDDTEDETGQRGRA